MRYEENPFNILHVSMRDSQDKILDKVEDLSLTLDEALCSQAASILTNPTKRLEAEVSWFPGYTPKKVKEAFEDAKSAPDEFIDNLSADNLSYADVNAEILAFLNIPYPTMLESYLLKIASDLEDIDTDALLNELNKERNAAGIPSIPNIDVLTTALHNRQKELSEIIYSFLKGFGRDKLVDILTSAIEESTDLGELESEALLLQLIEKYEVDIQSSLEEAASKVEQQITFIRDSADNGISDRELNSAIDTLDSLLKAWDRLAQPIQVSMLSQGLEHSASKMLAYSIRQLALKVYNEHNQLDASKRLIALMQNVFAEVLTVAEKTSEDITILNEIANKAETVKNNFFVQRANNSVEISITRRNPSKGLLSAHGLMATANKTKRTLVKMISLGFALDTPIDGDELDKLYLQESAFRKYWNDLKLPIRMKDREITLDNGGEILIATMDAYAQGMLECITLYANETKDWEESIKFLLKAQEFAFEHETKNKIENAIKLFKDTLKNTDRFSAQAVNPTQVTTGCLLPILSILILCALLFAWM